MIDLIVLTTGIFLGICLTFIGVFTFIYIARRHSWLEVRIAPIDPTEQSTKATVEDIYVKLGDCKDMGELNKRFLENIETRLTEVETELAPYIKKK